MADRTNTGGGNTRVTSANCDILSHGGSSDYTYDKNGSLVDITHNTPDGKSHSHEVSHGWFGPFAGSIKK